MGGHRVRFRDKAHGRLRVFRNFRYFKAGVHVNLNEI